MVAIHSVSFNYFDSNSYRNSTGIMAQKLKLPANADAMADAVSRVANMVRKLISEELSSKLITIKFDGASRHNRKILGINSQHLHKGKQVIRTLSMEEMTDRHTAVNLKDRIMHVLETYGLGIRHLYAAVTDQARNGIKCTELMRAEQDKVMAPTEHDTTADEVDGVYGDHITQEDHEDVAMDETVEGIISMVDDILQHGTAGCIEVIKCGAHSLNLVFKDALKGSPNSWLGTLRKEHVLKVAKMLDMLKEPVNPETEHSAPRVIDDFAAMLEEECGLPATEREEDVDLKLALINMANATTRLHHDTDIIKHWESKASDNKQLYELACVVLGAPISQVSVERCFSYIKLLLENHRLRMSNERLNDLMIIRCNRDLLPAAILKMQL
ncbi:hypothetical protein pipiens_007595 [Culex pipiens pipiens]|uniref:HAT C-terminal dimerisation domain-containing protein n=1 Tax=Culex pipiens pipiens TaxID=38569 RepID=A0ABD1DKL1_CULPP